MFYVLLHLGGRMKEIGFYTLGYVVGVLSMLGAEYIAKKERDKRNDG